MAVTFDLAINAVVNDGQNASFEVSNIQGVPVSGCPIGKTFLGRGVGYTAFSPTEWDDFGQTAVILGDGSASFVTGVYGVSTDYTVNTNLDRFEIEFLFNVSQNAFPSELALVNIFSLENMFRPSITTSASGVRIRDLGWTGEDTGFISEWLDTDFVVKAKLTRTGGKICLVWSITGGGVTYESTEYCVTETNIGGSIETGVYRATGLSGVNKSQCNYHYFTGIGFESNCTGEVADATIEYYRNGVLDYTGNPWSFPADGNMDGDSIVARVSGGIGFDFEAGFLDENYTPQGVSGTTQWDGTSATLFTATGTTTYRQRATQATGFLSRIEHTFTVDEISSGVPIAIHAVRSDASDLRVRYFRDANNNGMGVDVLQGGSVVYVEMFQDSIFTGDEYTCVITINPSTDTMFVEIERDRSGVKTTKTETFSYIASGAEYSTLSASINNTNTFTKHRVAGYSAEFKDSDPVTMSVLQYTAQPPSPQNLTEGDPLSLTWDWKGVTGDYGQWQTGVGYPSNYELILKVRAGVGVSEAWAGSGVTQGVDCNVVRSVDGGLNWTIWRDYPDYGQVQDIYVVGDEDLLVCVGGGGADEASLVRSTTAGDQVLFTIGEGPTGEAVGTIRVIQQSDSSVVLLVANFITNRGEVYRAETPDGTYTRVLQLPINTPYARDIIGCGGGVLIVTPIVSGGTATPLLWRSDDYGVTWSSVDAGYTITTNAEIYLAEITTSKIISTNVSDNNPLTALKESLDCGLTWQAYSGALPPSHKFSNYSFNLSQTTCILGRIDGSVASVMTTRDGGVTWEEYPLSDTTPNAVFMASILNDGKMVAGSGFGTGLGRLYSSEIVAQSSYRLLKDSVEQTTGITTDTTINYSIPSVSLSDAGTYQLEIANGGRDPFLSDVVDVNVTRADVFIPVVREIALGDPKMFFSPDGMTLQFENGLPVMEQGLENYSAITLGTEEGFSGYRIARNGSEVVDNSFLKESRKSITRNQIRIIEDAAKKAYQGAIADGLLKSVSATITFASQTGYLLTVILTPPTGEDRILLYNRNGENWIQQRNG